MVGINIGHREQGKSLINTPEGSNTLKRYNILFFTRIMVFDSSYIYGANSLQNSGGKEVFLQGWFHGAPHPGTNGSKRTLVGVKVLWSLKC